MPNCKITNQTDNNVLLRLSSGRTVQLGPREATAVDVAEVRLATDTGDGPPTSGNPRIARLLERRLITIDADAPAARKSTAKKSTAKKSTAKKSTAKKSTAKKSTAKKSTAAASSGSRK